MNETAKEVLVRALKNREADLEGARKELERQEKEADEIRSRISILMQQCMQLHEAIFPPQPVTRL